MNPLLDAPAVAALLGISRAAAYREMKMQQRVIVTEAAVEAYVRQRTKGGFSAASRCTARARSLAPDAVRRRR